VKLKIKESYKGTLSLLTGALLYASFGVFIREMNKMFGVYAQVTARYLIVVVAALILTLTYKISLKIDKKDLLKVTIFSVMFPITVILFTISALNTKISISVFLLYGVGLIFSVILGKILFKEKINRQRSVSVITSLLGLLIFSGLLNNSFSLGLGMVTGFFAGVFDSLANASRKLVKGIAWQKLLFWQFSFGALISLAISIVSGEQFIKQVRISSIVVTIIFGLCLTLLSRLLLYGFSKVDINIATPILAMELVFSVILGYIFLQESPSNNQILGGLFIMLATIIASLDLTRFKKIKT
jgi:drug/metabolite transporter (DMT)-like permease